MILVDANLLLYAYNQDSPHHAIARAWLESEISSGKPVRLALVTLLAFVRIGSDNRVFSEPLSPAEACDIVQSWLETPNVQMLAPGPRTWTHLAELCDRGQARAALVMDAHLAALALEHGAAVASTDRDFNRFDGIKTINPLLDKDPG